LNDSVGSSAAAADDWTAEEGERADDWTAEEGERRLWFESKALSPTSPCILLLFHIRAFFKNRSYSLRYTGVPGGEGGGWRNGRNGQSLLRQLLEL
jgi:hypothetical protein